MSGASCWRVGLAGLTGVMLSVAGAQGLRAQAGPGAEARGPALELAFGVVSGPGALGHSGVIEPTGYLELGGLDPAPVVVLVGSLPTRVPGLRAMARVAWAPGADVGARWTPCPPGSACPSILIEPDTRVSRFEAAAGVDVEVPARVGPVVPGVSLAVGVRRYGIAWDELGEADGPFHLPEGSHGETDLLIRGGVSATLNRGSVALVTRVEAGTGEFGPGVVPGPGGGAGGVDLGRHALTEYTLTVGLRKAFR